MKTTRPTARLALRVAAAAVACAPVATTLLPTPAAATTTYSGIHVVQVTGNSFTVTLNSLGTGWRYRIFYSTSKPAIYATNMSKAPHTALAAKPKIVVANLRYSTSVYWWRIQALKGSSHRLASMYSVGLRPTAPTNLAANTAPGQGTSVTWSSGGATGFNVQQALDPAFTQGTKTYVTKGLGHQLTPYGLTLGTTYYFRARAINNGTASPWSTSVQTVAQSLEQPIRIMSYNIQTIAADGTSVSGGQVPPWSQRKPQAVKLVREVDPDVISVQEGSSFVGAKCSPRQADDLASAVGGYTVAVTEVKPCSPNWFRTGQYILYKTATYAAVGTGDHWDLGDTRWAAYQILQNRSSGAQFLFVDPHLTTGSGATYDQKRQNEAETVLSQAQSYAAAHGNIPIVYAGDFNSHDGPNHPVDGPAVAMRAANIAEGLYVAQSITNSRYDSANDDNRTPPAFGHSIDHVYAPPGVGVVSWALKLDLSHGQFVGAIPSDHNPLYCDLVIPYVTS